MTRFIVIRHGESIWNRQQRIQGTLDAPLSKRGIRQARLLAERLKREKIDVAYSSPLQRALKTAEIVLRHHQLSPILEEALQEINFGIYQGKTIAEILKEDPSFDGGENSLDQMKWKVKGGQSLGEKLEQFKKRFNYWCQVHQGKTILLSTHGGIKRALAVYLKLIKPKEVRKLMIQNASVSIFRFEKGKLEVELFNDSSHLSEGDLERE